MNEEADRQKAARASSPYSSATASISHSFALLLDVLAPPLCPVTDEPLAANGQLSAAAWSTMQFVDEPFCVRCGAPFTVPVGDNAECAGCIAEPPDFDSARAAVVYDDASHGLIVSYKHADRTDLTPLLAGWLARAGASLLTADAIIIPTPLHRRRLFARRYNQAALLAKAVAEAKGVRFEPMLIERTRATPPQKDLSLEGRRRNVAGAFALKRGAASLVEGRDIVLVDDVLTTGATLSACARALKKAGARRVDALVLARAIRGGAPLG